MSGLIKQKKRSPLYDNPRSPGYEEWEAQPGSRVDDRDNASTSPDKKGTAPTADEIEHALGQNRANVGRDMPIKWRSIKTVGTRV